MVLDIIMCITFLHVQKKPVTRFICHNFIQKLQVADEIMRVICNYLVEYDMADLVSIKYFF